MQEQIAWYACNQTCIHHPTASQPLARHTTAVGNRAGRREAGLRPEMATLKKTKRKDLSTVATQNAGLLRTKRTQCGRSRRMTLNIYMSRKHTMRTQRKKGIFHATLTQRTWAVMKDEK